MVTPIARLARVIAHRPWATLVLALAVVVALASQIPRIQADFTPSDLFARVAEAEATASEFEATFGNTDNVLLVLVSAPDVYAVDTLQVVHDISRLSAEVDAVARVDSMTTVPLPRAAEVLVDPERSAIELLWAVGSGVAAQVSSLAAAARGEPGTASRPPRPGGLDTLAAGGPAPPAPGIAGDRVQVAEAERLRVLVGGSPLLVGQLVSADATVAAVAIQLETGVDRAAAVASAVSDVESGVAALSLPDGVSVSFGGLPYLRSALSARVRADQSVMLPASILVCVLLLAVAFRWLPALLLPLFAVVSSAAALVGAMAVAGERFNILNNIIPLLIVIIGISNAFHVLSRYFEERRAGRAHRDGVEAAVSAMLVACFLTSFTTAVGFGTLVVSRTGILKGFGIWAALGVMIAYAVTLTMLPAAMSLCPAPRASTRRSDDEAGWLERVLARAVRGVLARPWPVLAVSALVLVAGGVVGSRVQVDSAVLDQFDESDPLHATTRLIEEKLAGVRPLEGYLRSDTPGFFDDPDVLAAVGRAASWAEAQEGVIGTQTYGDYLAAVRGMVEGNESAALLPTTRDEVERLAAVLGAGDRDPTRSYVDADRTHLRLNVRLRDFGARRTVEFSEALRGELDAQLEPWRDQVRVDLTGDAYTSSLGLRAVIGDLGGSLGLAIVIIFVFLSVLFRSPTLGLVSIPPNATPLVLTLAAMSMTSIPLNAATVIIFSVSIGMGVDGTIHIFARVTEELRRGLPVHEAIVRSAEGTGRAIVLTNLSLLLGFAVMLLSAFVPVQRFGLLVGATMFASTFSTVFTLPALLAVTLRGRTRGGAARAAQPTGLEPSPSR
jgi:predicted RND superfamily exporter protein